MKRKNNTEVTSEPQVMSYIQPSQAMPGQPAHVVQDGWIAYLPSGRYAKPSFERSGRGFFNGSAQKSYYSKKG